MKAIGRYGYAGIAAVILHAVIICAGGILVKEGGVSCPSAAAGGVLSVSLHMGFATDTQDSQTEKNFSTIEQKVTVEQEMLTARSDRGKRGTDLHHELGFSGLDTGSGKEFTLYQKPQPEEEIHPPYPLGARIRGEEGVVTIKVSVNVLGQVENIILVESCGFSTLDQAALKAVQSSRFKPALWSDKPVAGEVVIRINFQLH